MIHHCEWQRFALIEKVSHFFSRKRGHPAWSERTSNVMRDASVRAFMLSP